MLVRDAGRVPASARKMLIRAIGFIGCVTAILACGGGDNGASGSGGATSSGASSGVIFSAGGQQGGSAGGQQSSSAGGQQGVMFSAGGQQSGSGGGAAASTGTTSACTGAETAGCVGERYEGEQVPLDLYIMFDVSCSMSCPAEQTGPGLCCRGGPNPRIDQVRNATEQFLQDPASAGMGVGIGYFGFMQGGMTSCDPSRYSAPSVPIAALPGNAAALVTSLNAAQPTGETPTGAAIRGACTYAAQWQSKNRGHKTVVLLVTDGFPEAPTTSQNGGCTPTIADAVQASTTCFGYNPPLPVYVLGVGAQLTNLGEIATAGGTEQPFIVSGADITSQIFQALNQIRALAQIPCQINLPPPPAGATLNTEEVNVGFCDAASQSTTFNYVETEAGCSASGSWRYDDPSAPTQIVLCPDTCSRVNVPGGSLFASVGCRTQTIIR